MYYTELNYFEASEFETSWERHKSAPCLRLKNSKRTVKYSFTIPKKPNWRRIGPLSEFSIFLSRDIKKIEGGPFEHIDIFFRKQFSQCRKN